MSNRVIKTCVFRYGDGRWHASIIEEQWQPDHWSILEIDGIRLEWLFSNKSEAESHINKVFEGIRK